MGEGCRWHSIAPGGGLLAPVAYNIITAFLQAL